MWTIAKTFHFSAAHQLHGLPEGHRCGRLHGHTYTVEVILESDELDSVGFVRDYHDLEVIERDLMDTFDHRNLNEVVPRGMPTTVEHLACWFYGRWSPSVPELRAVRVSESNGTWGEYRP